MDENLEAKDLVEAALFLAGRWLTAEEIAKTTTASTAEVTQILETLRSEYAARKSPIEITQEEAAFKMEVQPTYLTAVKDFAPQMDMSRALIQTLSFISFHQPVKQSRTVDKFGNRTYEYVRELLKRGLITATPKGHTKELRTTQKLLEYLGAEDANRIKDAMEKAQADRDEKKKTQAAQEKKLRTSLPSIADLKKRKDLSADDWMQLNRAEDEEIEYKKMEKFEKALEKALNATGEDEF